MPAHRAPGSVVSSLVPIAPTDGPIGAWTGIDMLGVVTAPLDPTTLRDQLRALGLRAGDVVMVHASLRAIGPVEGRADGVIDAILAAIGPDGTMLMVLGSRDDFSWVDRRPEDERAALLAAAPPFDARTTPADPEVGTLAEVLRQRDGVRLSDHPDGRFAALGGDAERFVANVPWDDYFGAGSPLERLVEADGRVLRLGADRDTVTLIHHAEWLADLPAKARVRRHHRVRTSSGPVVRVVDTLDDEHGIVTTDDGSDYFVDLLDAYLATGAARVGRVGGATAELIEARSFLTFAVPWLEARFGGA